MSRCARQDTGCRSGLLNDTRCLQAEAPAFLLQEGSRRHPHVQTRYLSRHMGDVTRREILVNRQLEDVPPEEARVRRRLIAGVDVVVPELEGVDASLPERGGGR